jgi:glycosidase
MQNWDMQADHIAFGGFPQARAAAVINAMLPGVPMTTNGEESGNTNFGGGTGLNTMAKVDFNGSNAATMRSFFTSLFALRADNATLQRAPVTWLSNSSNDVVLSFTRSDASGTFLVLVNLSGKSVSGSLDGVPSVAGWSDVSPRSSPGGTNHTAPPAYNLQAHDFAVFQAK